MHLIAQGRLKLLGFLVCLPVLDFLGYLWDRGVLQHLEYPGCPLALHFRHFHWVQQGLGYPGALEHQGRPKHLGHLRILVVLLLLQNLAVLLLRLYPLPQGVR